MGKLNVVLDWFANTNHTGFLLAEKRGYFAEAGLEVHIDGEVHGVMDLHGADFVLGPQISMLDCMSRGVERLPGEGLQPDRQQRRNLWRGQAE